MWEDGKNETRWDDYSVLESTIEDTEPDKKVSPNNIIGASCFFRFP